MSGDRRTLVVTTPTAVRFCGIGLASLQLEQEGLSDALRTQAVMDTVFRCLGVGQPMKALIG